MAVLSKPWAESSRVLCPAERLHLPWSFLAPSASALQTAGALPRHPKNPKIKNPTTTTFSSAIYTGDVGTDTPFPRPGCCVFPKRRIPPGPRRHRLPAAAPCWSRSAPPGPPQHIPPPRGEPGPCPLKCTEGGGAGCRGIFFLVKIKRLGAGREASRVSCRCCGVCGISAGVKRITRDNESRRRRVLGQPD